MDEAPSRARTINGFIIGVAGLLLAVSITSCLGPDGEAGSGLLLSFEATEFVEQTTAPPKTEDGTITVRRRFTAPCVAVPESLGGEAERHDTELTLRVRWTSPTNACANAITRLFYEAVLGRLSSGTYTLRILHVYQFVNTVTRQDTVMTQTIKVS